MAGILVSGGVFSGSGDLTSDWFYALYNTAGTGRVTLPDGVFHVINETGNNAFVYQWQGSSDYLHHSSGTVKITKAGGTTLNMAGASAANVATNRKGQLYDVIINQGSNPRVMDPVTLTTVESTGFYLGIENSLTIVSGTARIGDADVTNKTELGHVYIGASGTFSAGKVKDVNNGGYDNWYSSGSISMKSVLFTDINSVFVANGGTIKVLGPYTGNGSDHYVWENNSKGTLYHNSGAIQFGGGTVLGESEVESYNNIKNINRAADGTAQTSNGDGGWFYNVSGGFRDHGAGDRHLGIQYLSPLKVAKNLSLMVSGSIDVSTYDATISGHVLLDSDAYWGNYSTQGGTKTFGSFIQLSDSYFKAPTGTLTINGPPNAGNSFKNQEGTFVHNDGTVDIRFTGTDAVHVRNENYFYNYEQTLGATAHRVNWRGEASAPFEFRIANNCTLKEGSFRPSAKKYQMCISGTLDVQDGANYGYPGGDYEAHAAIGTININSGGNMYAASGLTTLTAGNFTDAGTFHHNSGSLSAKAGHAALILGASETAFYDIKSASEGSGVSTFKQYTNKIVEHDMITGSKELQWQLVADGVKLTLGTTSYASQIDADYFDGGGAGTQYVYSASELFPAVFKSSIQFLRYMGHPGQAGYMAANAHVKWVDVQKAITTPGASKKLILDAESKFVDFTLTNGDALHASGTRIETDSLLLDGVFVGSGSLIVCNDKLKTNSNSTIYNSGTTTIVGHTGSSTCRWNRGTWDTIMYNGSTGDVQFDTNGNTPTNFIIGNGTLNTKGMHFNGATAMTAIANGGTLNHTGAIAAGGIYKTTNFNNRGGLFTSSSAFDFDGAASSGGLINAGADSSIDNIFDGGGTVEGWVKLASGGGANVGRLVSKDDWFIYFREDSFKNIRLQYTFDGGGAEWYTENDTFTFDNRWHHVAVTYDNSNVANDPSIYLDGKLVPLGTIVRPTGTRVSEVGDVLYVGNNPTGIRTLDGPVGMIRMFSDVRTAKEIRTDMFNQKSNMVNDGALVLMYQFDEGQGTTVTDVSTNSNTGTITKGTSGWADMGTWTAGGPLGASTEVIAGNIYLGKHATDATLFASSYFTLNNRKLVDGSKMASKSHMGTLDYYIATSGANDYLNYQKLDAAPIGTESEVYILADGSNRSYFNFDSSANNEQTHSLVNAGFVRIVNNSDFYTQDFDNSQGVWIRDGTYGGIIHDDGSTPNEYQPIDIMDDQDSGFDTPELID